MAREPEYMVTLKGTSGSPGIVFGRAYLVDRKILRIPRESIPGAEVAAEIQRFIKAVADSKAQLLETKQRIDKVHGKEHIFIIETHLMIMEDQTLLDDVINVIREENINAEWALRNVFDKLKKVFDNIEDESLRERKTDFDHISRRILQNLMGIRQESPMDFEAGAIVVAHDLSPYDMAHLDRDKVFGIATDIGGNTSHMSILARAMGIPSVVGLEEITTEVKAEDMMILDGLTGTVIINPSVPVVEDYHRRKRKYEKTEADLLSLVNLPSQTMDGHHVTLSANMELPEEISSMRDHGIKNIGLFRSEYLYLVNHEMPTEEQHYNFYKQILERVAPHTATIRTLDVGGDKFLSQFDIPREANPALGLRAIRFCLKKPNVFKTQLRALVTAGAYGKLKIMFPMISGLEEVLEAKKILNDVIEELKRDGVKVGQDIPVGIMMEVPSASMIADVLAREVDFFSIGTNDLIQYSLAIDRINEHVSYLYRPLHPAILRMIKDIVDAGHAENIPVSCCGEMAGEPLYLPLLIGIGLDELSMNTISVLKVKKILLSTTIKQAKEFADHALSLGTTRAVEKFVVGEMKKRFPEEFENYEVPPNGLPQHSN